MGGLMQLVAYGAQDCFLGRGSSYSTHWYNDYKKPDLFDRLYMNFDVDCDKENQNVEDFLSEIINECLKVETVELNLKIFKKIEKQQKYEKGRSINCEDKEWSADNKIANIKKREKKEKTRFANNNMKNQMRVQMRRR